MKEESSSTLRKYKGGMKLRFKSGINNDQRSTQTTKFMHYLVTRHPQYKNKDIYCLSKSREVLREAKCKCNKQISNSFVKAQRTSFKTSHLNAETMKPYNTGDTLVRPGASKGAFSRG
jgi:hypothetical protein